ncbi:MAG: IclR family transcriptional regulator [Actinomycetes bacterium]
MQPVIRALRVLQILAPSYRGLSLQELHEALDIPVGSVHRLLATLADQGFVTRSPANRRYFLGPAARQLAEQNTSTDSLLVSPHPAVLEVAHQTGETVFLTELFGDRAVCVALVEGRHPLRLFVRIGQEMPLHAAASARCLLAYAQESLTRLLLTAHPLAEFTPETPTGVEEVLGHLALVRGRGYDVCDDELDRGVWAVAAPVFVSTGHVCASITMAGAGERMRDRKTRVEATEAVVAAAGRMSEELGYAAAPGDPARMAGARTHRQRGTQDPVPPPAGARRRSAAAHGKETQ